MSMFTLTINTIITLWWIIIPALCICTYVYIMESRDRHAYTPPTVVHTTGGYMHPEAHA